MLGEGDHLFLQSHRGPDEDGWHAYCPALQAYGAATWGDTEEEAYKHIHEVFKMIVEELREAGTRQASA